jgi:hypothetical protein
MDEHTEAALFHKLLARIGAAQREIDDSEENDTAQALLPIFQRDGTFELALRVPEVRYAFTICLMQFKYVAE